MEEQRLQILIAKLQNRILALKTSSRTSPRIQAFTYRFQDTGNTRVKITYADGSQPIITEAYREYGDVICSTLNGNIQYAFPSSQTVGDIVFVSTRKINSVEAA